MRTCRTGGLTDEMRSRNRVRGASDATSNALSKQSEDEDFNKCQRRDDGHDGPRARVSGCAGTGIVGKACEGVQAIAELCGSHTLSAVANDCLENAHIESAWRMNLGSA